MKIVKKYLRIDPIAGADGYRIYCQAGGVIDQETTPNFDVGNMVEGIDLYELLGDVEGNYSIGYVGYDNAGNEGGMYIIVEDYPLDFVPPATGTGGEIYSLP